MDKIEQNYEIRSLAYMTDLSIIAFRGNVEDKGDYIVAVSTGNPGYFWGNLLLMKQPPEKEDFQRWCNLFNKEFSYEPQIKHITFGWDSPEALEGNIDSFIANGFDVEKSIVLTLVDKDLISPKHNLPELDIRALQTDKEWEEAIQNQILCRQSHFNEDLYTSFKRTQMQKYRDMTCANLGNWYGAFLENKLVADCGFFIFNGVGRFQSVGTHPDFRNRSICANLIYSVSKKAFHEKKAAVLVMVADPEYHAARVYESVGFVPTEKQIGVYRWPKEEWANKNTAT